MRKLLIMQSLACLPPTLTFPVHLDLSPEALRFTALVHSMHGTIELVNVSVSAQSSLGACMLPNSLPALCCIVCPYSFLGTVVFRTFTGTSSGPPSAMQETQRKARMKS